MRDELSFHIEASVRDLMASGMDERAARAEALRRFGNVRGVEDRLRVIGHRRVHRRRLSRWATDLKQDLRHTLRNLRRYPLFASMMVLILALGVAVNAAVFRVVDGALLRPLPYPDGDRLVRVFAGETMEGRFNVSLPEYRDWAREVDVVAASAATYATGRTLLEPGAAPEAILVGVIEGDIMGVLGLPPVLGRAITEEDIRRGERVAMLDEAAWRGRWGGRPDIIGHTLSFVGEQYTVIGVLPEEARILPQHPTVQLWIPLVETEWMVRGTHFLRVTARLRPGMSVAAAASRADITERSLIDAGTTDHGMVLVGAREQIVTQARPVLFALMGAVGFVLLIVCANLANLFHAHALGRTREFAVRASLGAGRGRLMRQVVTEGVVLGLAGGVTGLILARLLHGLVTAASQGAALLAPGSALDLRVVGFALGLSMLAGAVVGMWPALRVARVRLGDDLGGSRTVGDRRAWRRRRWLVGAEVALSVMLLAGAGLMVRSVLRLLQQDPGFDAAGVLTFELALPATRYEDPAIPRFYDALLAAIRELPGVAQAGATSHLPLSGSDTNGNFRIVGREFPEDQRPHTMKRVVTPGYFEALRIPLVAGRLPAATDDRSAADIVVISETLARQYWPDGDAIGQRVRFSWGPPGEQTVVGVVGDIRHDGLDEAPASMMYRTLPHFEFSTMAVVVRAEGDPLRLVAPVRTIVRNLDPELPMTDVRTLDAVVTASIGDRSTLMRLLAGFGTLALLLAALGVYAVAAQAVQQRRREIGVRMAVGARARDVLGMVVGQELVPVAIGLLLGVAGALAATQVLQASLFGVTARDPGALAAATALIGAAALLATALPARRAARTHPASVLRDA